MNDPTQLQGWEDYVEKSNRIEVLCVSTVFAAIDNTPQVEPVSYDGIPGRYSDVRY
jgi:hypothetical protein